MNQQEIEQVIKYQQKTYEYLTKWLAEQVEKDKKEFIDSHYGGGSGGGLGSDTQDKLKEANEELD